MRIVAAHVGFPNVDEHVPVVAVLPNIARKIDLDAVHVQMQGLSCTIGPALVHLRRKGSVVSAARAREMLDGSGGESYMMIGPIGSDSRDTEPSQADPSCHGFAPTASGTLCQRTRSVLTTCAIDKNPCWCITW